MEFGIFSHKGFIFCEVIIIYAYSSFIFNTAAKVYGHIFSYQDLTACGHIMTDICCTLSVASHEDTDEVSFMEYSTGSDIHGVVRRSVVIAAERTDLTAHIVFFHASVTYFTFTQDCSSFTK